MADDIEKLVERAEKAETEAAFYAKALMKLRNTLMLIQDHLEDEGDRVYFGSTNDADKLREIAQHIEDMHWDEIMASSQPPVDLYAMLAEQRAQVSEAASTITTLQAELAKLQAVYDAARGLVYGTDWNHGTHAKLHGYRNKLIDAVVAIEPDLNLVVSRTPTP